MTRTFEAKPAVRGHVPLLIGLTGPSGGGKTFSALRLATGIQRVTGGDIYGIDTESRRMLHYADKFKFQHVQFDAPFGSLDYLEAIRYCIEAGAKIIIVDSMSHEHEGDGGCLDFHEKELDRMAGEDYAKREKCGQAAWVKPKSARNKLVLGFTQMDANIIFCFRAKDLTKPVRSANGKMEVVHCGFVPISGDRIVFEMTMNAMLLPKADGVPSWKSENPGESMAMKLPEQFKAMFAERRPLSEEIGQQLAEWAKGGEKHSSVVESLARRAEFAADADDINVLLPELSGMTDLDNRSSRRIIKARAEALGLTFDKEAGLFLCVATEKEVANA